jgi:phosphoserine phosphatase RsbU/P
MCAVFHAAKSASIRLEATQSRALDLHEAQLAAVSYGRPGGGDLYDYSRINESRILFALLDIAGPLDQNRAIIDAAQSTLRSSGMQLLAQEDVNEADAMIEVCVQMNRAILQAAERVCPCPVFAGCYNESLGTVCYVNAGHTPGLLRDSTGIAELGATGLPLGLFSHSAADASIVAVELGAALLVVSRGLAEARSKKTEFGLSQVKDLLLRTQGQSAQEVCAVLLEKVQKFMAGIPAPNDVTAICLSRQDKALPAVNG